VCCVCRSRPKVIVRFCCKFAKLFAPLPGRESLPGSNKTRHFRTAQAQHRHSTGTAQIVHWKIDRSNAFGNGNRRNRATFSLRQNYTRHQLFARANVAESVGFHCHRTPATDYPQNGCPYAAWQSLILCGKNSYRRKKSLNLFTASSYLPLPPWRLSSSPNSPPSLQAGHQTVFVTPSQQLALPQLQYQKVIFSQ